MNASSLIAILVRPCIPPAVALLAVAGVARCFGADAPAIPPAPAGFILDEARALPDDVQAALSAEIRKFRDATGCGLWMVTTTYLSGTSARERADALADAWIADGRGVVLTYDRAGDTHAIAPTDTMWLTYPTPMLVEAFRDAGVVIQEKNRPLDQRLLDSARLLMREITEADQQVALHNQLLPGHDRWAAIVFLALLVGGALACAMILAAVRKRDSEEAVRYFFPQAEGHLRFGAPYGGGVIAEVKIGGS